VKLLALARGHRIHREQAMDLLWPDLGRRAAAHNLHQVLYIARRILDPDIDHTSSHLVLREEQLVLCPQGELWVDTDAFEEEAAEARRARSPASYRVALNLYVGELLPGDLYEEWAQARREELRRTYLDLLIELAALYEEREEVGSAITALRRVVAEESANERAHALLMRLYALTGRHPDALQQYEQLRDILWRELGAEPGAASRRLYEEISSGRFPPPHPSPKKVDPARKTPGEGPHNLPASRTTFVGRERDIAEIERALSMTRLLTLTGTGGSGKTRLALEVARNMIGAYTDGVWLVELAPLSEEALLPQALAAVLGVQEQREHSLTDTLVDFLRKKEALLVVDNCEHLVDAVTPLVDALLDSCPHLKVLATSREALGIVGEMNRPVPPLSLPDPSGRPTAEELERYESVRLFVERARFRNPAFSLTSENAHAVAEICQRLEGIPLAIELAAGRLGLSVEQIASRLDDSLRILSAGSRSATPRQRTLRGGDGLELRPLERTRANTVRSALGLRWRVEPRGRRGGWGRRRHRRR
jgi:DNA-binding SARP family transcriptional activator